MKSSEARAISEQFPTSPRIKELLDEVYSGIHRAAERGYRAMECPIKRATEEERRVIRAELERQGYKVVEDSDQRDGSSWTTVSW